MSHPSTRAPRIPAGEARHRILAAARTLLVRSPFAELTVDAVMAAAGLPRTVFYRHYTTLAQLAPDLLPDEGAPLVERVAGEATPAQVVAAMVDGLVTLYAEHGPLLRAIDDAARHDADVAAHLERALATPRALLERLTASASHPPTDPAETARLLMATHRAYLLDAFGTGTADPGAPARARAALLALWERLLAA